MEAIQGKIQPPSPDTTSVEGTLVIAAATGRDVEIYGYKKEAGEEGDKSSSPKDVSLLLERGDHGLSTRERGNNKPGRRISMARSKDKSMDEKSTYRKVALPLPDMTVSHME